MTDDVIEATGPPTKRPKKSEDINLDNNLSLELLKCLKLLIPESSSSTSGHLPHTLLANGKTGNNIEKLRRIFDVHGFRTSVITSPRPALSIYLKFRGENDCVEDSSIYAGKEYLLSMLGMHEDMVDMERFYTGFMKQIYCFQLFCEHLNVIYSNSDRKEAISNMINSHTSSLRYIEKEPPIAITQRPSSPKSIASAFSHAELVKELELLSDNTCQKISDVIAFVVQEDSRFRSEQLHREFERIQNWNSTFSNALIQRFVSAHEACIKSVYFKRSCHQPQYERLTFYMFDPEFDQMKPPRFTFLPALHKMLQNGPDALAEDMVSSFWNHLLKLGYFPSKVLKDDLSPELKLFFLKGIASDLESPLLLNANFTPTYPLSLYLHGEAGAGKSSFVRNFTPSLNAAIADFLDPEILVRFVKQNLNKPFRDLELELELRPNNNDLSVMSIIQGRKMTLSQSKPGLVVIDLEEMASNDPDSNPNQLKTAQLISQRFSGRHGDYRETTVAPRNSHGRGISGDATLITIFTSNYLLENNCSDALKRLDMFSNLKCLEMSAVAGKDRETFACSYLVSAIHERCQDIMSEVFINLNIPVGNGDTRPLVRELRMLAFFICSMIKVNERKKIDPIFEIIITRVSKNITKLTVGGESIDLKHGTMGNIYPLIPQVFDNRTTSAIQKLLSSCGHLLKKDCITELTQIIDFYFAKTLAPAVIISQNMNLIENIVAAVADQENVHTISDVNPSKYKMMKSLYDPKDTPNLRDDILSFGVGSLVVLKVDCTTNDDQVQIREIIEDSPSMTAFSTTFSALYKDGLLFCIHLRGPITPEIQSRASLII